MSEPSSSAVGIFVSVSDDDELLVLDVELAAMEIIRDSYIGEDFEITECDSCIGSIERRLDDVYGLLFIVVVVEHIAIGFVDVRFVDAFFLDVRGGVVSGR